MTESVHPEHIEHRGDVLQVSELFYSIQGESTRAGLPCLFIRLSGCRLRCSYCDAAYTWTEPGTAYSVAKLCDWALGHGCKLVELTGGEPLQQEAVYPLMQALLAGGMEVLLESNGSITIDQVPFEVGVILDVKCPGSGMAAHRHSANLELLRRRAGKGSRDELKFVLSDVQDFHWALDFIHQHQLQGLLPILFSPLQPQFPPQKLAELILSHQAPARLQIQLHTLLWPGEKRGV